MVHSDTFKYGDWGLFPHSNLTSLSAILRYLHHFLPVLSHLTLPVWRLLRQEKHVLFGNSSVFESYTHHELLG